MMMIAIIIYHILLLINTLIYLYRITIMSIHFDVEDRQRLIDNIVTCNNKNRFTINLLKKDNGYKTILYDYIISDLANIIYDYTHDTIEVSYKVHDTYVNIVVENQFDVNISVDTELCWIEKSIAKYYFSFKYKIMDEAIEYAKQYIKQYYNSYVLEHSEYYHSDDDLRYNNYINYFFNLYMKLQYKQDDYVPYLAHNVLDKRTLYYNIVDYIYSKPDCVIAHDKSIMCIYETKYDTYTLITQKYDIYNDTSYIFIFKIIDHVKMKLMIDICKLFCSVTSNYIKPTKHDYDSPYIISPLSDYD